MVEIILNNGREYFKGNPPIYLKVNALFKDMGFQEVNTGGRLEDNLFCEKLTLFIYPVSNKYSLSNSLPPDILNLWKGLKGYYDILINRLRDYDIGIQIKIDGLHIGDYYKDRNFMVLYYPLHQTGLSLGANNHFLFYFLKELAKEIKKINPQIVDVSKKMREELINNFMKEIKESINAFQRRIIDKEVLLEEKRKEELQYMAEIHLKKEEVKVLKGTYRSMGANIEKKIQDIKKLPFVKRVGISNQGIRVDFRHIDLEWEGEKLELGECYAYLNPNKLEIKNKNYVRYNSTIYHAPHVGASAICFGDGSKKAHELLSSMKFKELVYFLYLFLKTYNNNDPYIKLHRWKLCKDNGGTYEGDEGDAGDGEDDGSEDDDEY